MKFNLKLTKIISILATLTSIPILTLTTTACGGSATNNPMTFDDTKIKLKLGLETLNHHRDIIPGIFLYPKKNLALVQVINGHIVDFPNDGTKFNCEIKAKKLLSATRVDKKRSDLTLNLPKVIGNDGKERAGTLDDFAYVDDPAIGTFLKEGLKIKVVNNDSTNNRDAFSKTEVDQYVLQLTSNNELVFLNDNLEVESQENKVLKVGQKKNIKNPILEFKWKKKTPESDEKTKFTYSEISSLKSYKITLKDIEITSEFNKIKLTLLKNHPFKIDEPEDNFVINKKINETDKWLNEKSENALKEFDDIFKAINKSYSAKLTITYNEGFNPENEKVTAESKIKVRAALFKEDELIAYLGSESDLITPLPWIGIEEL